MQEESRCSRARGRGGDGRGAGWWREWERRRSGSKGCSCFCVGVRPGCKAWRRCSHVRGWSSAACQFAGARPDSLQAAHGGNDAREAAVPPEASNDLCPAPKCSAVGSRRLENENTRASLRPAPRLGCTAVMAPSKRRAAWHSERQHKWSPPHRGIRSTIRTMAGGFHHVQAFIMCSTKIPGDECCFRQGLRILRQARGPTKNAGPTKRRRTRILENVHCCPAVTKPHDGQATAQGAQGSSGRFPDPFSFVDPFLLGVGGFESKTGKRRWGRSTVGCALRP
mmetsp:Transcript_22079/g.44663  ORF Transcript_22079/g.44663 Transcript_22079/m.44663 type:complete len:281 (-) Transcript_22079:41-883(-)